MVVERLRCPLINLKFRSLVFALSINSRISPSIAVVHFMRLHVRTKHRLVSELDCFDLDQAQCSSDFDRQFIVSGIIHWYGSKEAFTAYVRGPLRSELLKSSGMPNMPLPYLLLIILGAMSSSLTTLSALWAGGAPVEVVVKQLVGGTFGLEFFWFLPCVKLTLYLCDRFSARRLGMCDFTWSVAIFLVFFGLYYAGDELATLVRALGMLPCFLWCFCSFVICWLFCFRGRERLHRLTIRSSSPT